MARTIVVVGYGPGVGRAVAERFGGEGFAVALVGRNGDKLAAGVAALEARGVRAAAIVADAGDPDSIAGAMAEASAALGPVTVLHWNAYGGGARDLLAASPEAVRALFDTPIVGLLAAVRAALGELKAAGDGAVLITNGGFGLPSAPMDAIAARIKVMDTALANGAKHKLVGLLAEQLKPEGVFVGEVMVSGNIVGADAEPGRAGIASSAVADAFWEMYGARTDARASLSNMG